ncbi:anti-anti-sigma factor [Leptospira perolatii]|uniref:Anti-anti-sigma factor n=1 Tax=Leptospira perolatii TaxID=2023191 RepID=A0A2M9ZK88_9LEPT|nr:STAS domain-containing protein [Leptospira perolatii]PJZ69341.1 anti-anti-sigma factor [Leptospira perolatii]PJZ72476.1 anti-anti-sigma factor [Leptospira perolatii]
MDKPSTVVIKLNYEILNEDHESLRNYLNSYILENPKSVTLDLKEVQILTSIALGALVAFANRLKGQGIPLETINVSSKLQEIIKLVSLDQILGIH